MFCTWKFFPPKKKVFQYLYTEKCDFSYISSHISSSKNPNAAFLTKTFLRVFIVAPLPSTKTHFWMFYIRYIHSAIYEKRCEISIFQTGNRNEFENWILRGILKWLIIGTQYSGTPLTVSRPGWTDLRDPRYCQGVEESSSLSNNMNTKRNHEEWNPY